MSICKYRQATNVVTNRNGQNHTLVTEGVLQRTDSIQYFG